MMASSGTVYTLIPPFDHKDVIAGQGTAALELFEEVAAKPGNSDGVFRGETAGGVGQDGEAFGIDEVQQVSVLGVDEPVSSDGNGDDLGLSGVEALPHQFK